MASKSATGAPAGGLAGFGSQDPSIPERGAIHGKHRGRKGKKSRHSKKVKVK